VPCPRKVLIVEDDEDLLAVLEEVFASTCGPGSVTVARDGAEALARVRAGLVPCLVVTDLEMPRLSGAELVQALRAEGLGRVPVITMADSRDHPSDASAHLPKPFTLRQLERVLASTVGPECRFAPPAA
jgi:CheY-like chemotaxis protein